MKKGKIFVLLLVVFFSLGLVLASCTAKESLVLEDFPVAYSEDVQLLDVYEITITKVFDKDGNEYLVNSAVKTKEGADVTVVDNMFEITNLSGYVITYTAVIDEKTFSSVLTLNVIDSQGPVINITNPDDGITGEEYTLPTINVTDASGETIVPVIKVFYLNGETKEEIELTDNKFTPAKPGEYIVEVTASDSSNNSNSKQAIISVLNAVSEGEVADFDYAETKEQITANKAIVTNYVSSVENTDETYSGGYVELSSGNNEWVNTFLNPRQELDSYQGFDLLSAWIYPILANDAIEDCNFSFYNNAVYKVTVKSGEWTQVLVSADILISAYDNFVNGSQVFLPLNFNNANSTNHKSLVAFRLGNVFLHKNADFTVSVGNDSYIANGETTLEVALTVGSANDVVPANNLIVYNSSNEVLTAKSSADNVYKYDLPMGEYTYKALSTDSVYVGEAEGSFVVQNSTQIVVGDYGDYVAGEEIVFLDGVIYESGVATDSLATKSAKFVYAVDNTEIEVTSLDKFVPDLSGTLTITYSYTNAVDIIIEISVGRSTKEGYILDGSKDMIFDLYTNVGELTYVSAEENTDETYSGAYVVNRCATGWCQTNFSKNLNVTLEDLEGYDVISFWIYVEYETASDGLTWISFYNVFDVNGIPTNHGINVNRWVKVYLDIDAFRAKYDSLVAQNYFTSLKFGAIDGIRFGEMKLENHESTVAYNAETSKIEMSIANLENVDYAVAVTDSLGQAVEGFDFVLDKSTNSYDYSTTTSDAYTITVTYTYSIPHSRNSANVDTPQQITVVKTYTVTVE